MASPCQERNLLSKEHVEAGIAFDDARQALQARIGVSSREEFLTLDQAAERAWASLQHARQALDNHIRNHGCEKA
jgi:hypothetical protein